MSGRRHAPFAGASVVHPSDGTEGTSHDARAQPSDPQRKTTRILVIQPLPLFRRGIVSVLAGEPDFEVVGEMDRSGALASALGTSPEVVIVELSSTATSDAFRTSQRIRQEFSSATIVMLAEAEGQDMLLAALAAGAKALIPRSVSPKALVASLRRVVSGQDLLADQILAKPTFAMHAIDEFRSLAFTNQMSSPGSGLLSPRELEVLDQIAQGMSNKEIAEALSVSVHTVKNHMTHILRKLSVKRRAQAVTYAMRRGWIST
jgi:DNA-binding NarL/FixJ family response regulator